MWWSGAAVPAVNLVQLCLGLAITCLNLLLLAAVFGTRKLRTASHCLGANLWFANVILGVSIAVANVMKHQQHYTLADGREPLVGMVWTGGQRPSVLLTTTETTVGMINSMACLCTLLALNTARFVCYRDPMVRMSVWSALKVILFIWACILSLVVTKTVLLTLQHLGRTSVCYECLVGFELAMLVIFVVITMCMYAAAAWALCARRGRHIHIASHRVPPTRMDVGKETRDTITTGLCMSSFLAAFALLVALVSNGVISKHRRAEFSVLTSELLVCVFCVHALINPIVLVCRDIDVRASVCAILQCRSQQHNLDNDMQTMAEDHARALLMQHADSEHHNIYEALASHLMHAAPPPAYNQPTCSGSSQQTSGPATIV